ncbi:MAG: hypothetical protein KJ653_07165 [Candidatus Thermoplasmatota archaeon]|nr:hypothetical protein [Candidatus Thermoplasmatota archaeon]MBU1914651.1 hypothetical protein [Candidatus Thermoplasmatota archaeon]
MGAQDGPLAEPKPEPEAPSEDASSARRPSKKGINKKQKVLFVVSVVLIVLGLILSVYFQAKMDEELTLSKDFDHDFTSNGQTTNVNRDYLFPYNPMYNGTGTSTALSNYTTVTETTIKGVDSGNGYVEFSYVKEITEQPTLLIDVNTGLLAGGIAMLPSMAPGMPEIPYPFEPYQPTNSTMYLDEKNWTYRSDIYEANGLHARTGYARSVFTHHLEQQSYPIYIGSIGNTTTAKFGGVVKVQSIETYLYNYSYTFEIPFPIYTNQTTGLAAFLSFNESTNEYHEPITGALLKQTTTLTYYLTTVGQGAPNTVGIYSESNDYEISQEDARSFSQGLFWIHNSPTIASALILLGLMLIVVDFVMVFKARK